MDNKSKQPFIFFTLAQEQANKTKVRGPHDKVVLKFNYKLTTDTPIFPGLYTSTGDFVEDGLTIKKEDYIVKEGSEFFALNFRLNRPKKIENLNAKMTNVSFYLNIVIGKLWFRSNLFQIHTNQNQFQNLQLVKRRVNENLYEFKKNKKNKPEHNLENLEIQNALDRIDNTLKEHSSILEDLRNNEETLRNKIYICGVVGIDNYHMATLCLLGKKVGFVISQDLNNSLDFVILNSLTFDIQVFLKLCKLKVICTSLQWLHEAISTNNWTTYGLFKLDQLIKYSNLSIKNIPEKQHRKIINEINSIAKEDNIQNIEKLDIVITQ